MTPPKRQNRLRQVLYETLESRCFLAGTPVSAAVPNPPEPSVPEPASVEQQAPSEVETESPQEAASADTDSADLAVSLDDATPLSERDADVEDVLSESPEATQESIPDTGEASDSTLPPEDSTVESNSETETVSEPVDYDSDDATTPRTTTAEESADEVPILSESTSDYDDVDGEEYEDDEKGDAELSDAELSDAEPSDAEPSDAEPSDAEPSDAEPSDDDLSDGELDDAELDDGDRDDEGERDTIAANVPRDEQTSDARDQESTSGPTSQPDLPAPSVPEPSVPEPSVPEPSFLEPSFLEPSAPELASTEPDSTELDSTEPDSTEPDSTQSDKTVPGENELDKTELGATKLDETETTDKKLGKTSPDLTEAAVQQKADSQDALKLVVPPAAAATISETEPDEPPENADRLVRTSSTNTEELEPQLPAFDSARLLTEPSSATELAAFSTAEVIESDVSSLAGEATPNTLSDPDIADAALGQSVALEPTLAEAAEVAPGSQLPPGLSQRTTLPKGLANRDSLPNGLARRMDTSNPAAAPATNQNAPRPALIQLGDAVATKSTKEAVSEESTTLQSTVSDSEPSMNADTAGQETTDNLQSSLSNKLSAVSESFEAPLQVIRDIPNSTAFEPIKTNAPSVTEAIESTIAVVEQAFIEAGEAIVNLVQSAYDSVPATSSPTSDALAVGTDANVNRIGLATKSSSGGGRQAANADLAVSADSAKLVSTAGLATNSKLPFNNPAPTTASPATQEPLLPAASEPRFVSTTNTLSPQTTSPTPPVSAAESVGTAKLPRGDTLLPDLASAKSISENPTGIGLERSSPLAVPPQPPKAAARPVVRAPLPAELAPIETEQGTPEKNTSDASADQAGLPQSNPASAGSAISIERELPSQNDPSDLAPASLNQANPTPASSVDRSVSPAFPALGTQNGKAPIEPSVSAKLIAAPITPASTPVASSSSTPTAPTPKTPAPEAAVSKVASDVTFAADTKGPNNVSNAVRNAVNAQSKNSPSRVASGPLDVKPAVKAESVRAAVPTPEEPGSTDTPKPSRVETPRLLSTQAAAAPAQLSSVEEAEVRQIQTDAPTQKRTEPSSETEDSQSAPRIDKPKTGGRAKAKMQQAKAESIEPQSTTADSLTIKGDTTSVPPIGPSNERPLVNHKIEHTSNLQTGSLPNAPLPTVQDQALGRSGGEANRSDATETGVQAQFAGQNAVVGVTPIVNAGEAERMPAKNLDSPESNWSVCDGESACEEAGEGTDSFDEAKEEQPRSIQTNRQPVAYAGLELRTIEPDQLDRSMQQAWLAAQTATPRTQSTECTGGSVGETPNSVESTLADRDEPAQRMPLNIYRDEPLAKVSRSEMATADESTMPLRRPHIDSPMFFDDPASTGTAARPQSTLRAGIDGQSGQPESQVDACVEHIHMQPEGIDEGASNAATGLALAFTWVRSKFKRSSFKSKNSRNDNA